MQNGKETPRFIEPEEARIRWLKSFDSKAGRYFPSGFKAQDQTVGALLRGTLTVICARPGIGKTAFLFALAYRQALAGVRTYFYNLEMPVEQMWNRMACLHDESLRLRDLNEGEVSDQKKAALADLSTKLAAFSPRFFE